MAAFGEATEDLGRQQCKRDPSQIRKLLSKHAFVLLFVPATKTQRLKSMRAVK